MLTLVADTNLFLQCRPLNELDWGEIDNELRVVVPDAAIRELDRHKQDGNTRRAKRARLSLALIERLIGGAVSLGSGVSIEIGTGARVSHDALSTGYADDLILQEALAIARNDDVALLTRDTLLLVKAKRVNIRAIKIPDGWMLTPERSEIEKEVEQLKNKIAELQRQGPSIELELDICSATSVNSYPPLTISDREDVLKFVRQKFFKAELHAEGHTELQKDHDEYERKYEQWISTIGNWTELMPRVENVRGCRILLRLQISNRGAAPATDLVLEIETIGSARLHNPLNPLELEALKMPLPPPPPLLRRTSETSFHVPSPFIPDFPSVDFPEDRSRRDPYALYVRSNEQIAKKFELECRDFRHGTEKALELVVIPTENKSIAVKVRATAANSPIPSETTKRIQVDLKTLDTIALVRERIELAEKSKVTLKIPNK